MKNISSLIFVTKNTFCCSVCWVTLIANGYITLIVGSYYLVDSGYAIGIEFPPLPPTSLYDTMPKSIGVQIGRLQSRMSCSIIGICHCEWWLNDALECWRQGSWSWMKCTPSHSLDNGWLWPHAMHCTTLYACITGWMKCFMCGKDQMCILCEGVMLNL